MLKSDILSAVGNRKVAVKSTVQAIAASCGLDRICVQDAIDELVSVGELHLDRNGTRLSRASAAGRSSGTGRVRPRTPAQRAYLETMRANTLTFGVGPAGTGKTFLAVAMAVQHYLEKNVRKLVLCRPAVEAGERLGFLPGTAEEKVEPYLQPLYDALKDLLPKERLAKMEIEVIPLAFLRGRSIRDAFIVMDEAQNATVEQMKMVLTRVDKGSRIVVTGDPMQVDLPKHQQSGLVDALSRFEGVPDIGIARFAPSDVQRHPLVQAVIDAYSR